MHRRFHGIILLLVLLLSVFGLPSCAEFKWRKIRHEEPLEYSFYLVTFLQSYQIEKRGDVMTIKARTYYYPPSSPKTHQYAKFSKVLKGGNEEIDNLIRELIQKGEFIPLAIKYSILPEGIHPSVGVTLKGREYRWNLMFADEMTDRGVVKIYTQLNEKLYYLFPELKELPTNFIFSENPPEHKTGKIWSWYDRE